VGRFWEHSVNNVLWLIVTQSYTVPWQRRKKVQSQLNIEHVNKSNRRFSGKICDCWNKLHFRGEWCVLHARIGLHFACFLSPIVICYCCLNRRLALEFAARTVLTMGSLNLQGMEFARKGGGLKIARKRKFKERLQNWHPCEFARTGICKEISNCNFLSLQIQFYLFFANFISCKVRRPLKILSRLELYWRESQCYFSSFTLCLCPNHAWEKCHGFWFNLHVMFPFDSVKL